MNRLILTGEVRVRAIVAERPDGGASQLSCLGIDDVIPASVLVVVHDSHEVAADVSDRRLLLRRHLLELYDGAAGLVLRQLLKALEDPLVELAAGAEAAGKQIVEVAAGFIGKAVLHRAEVVGEQVGIDGLVALVDFVAQRLGAAAAVTNEAFYNSNKISLVALDADPRVNVRLKVPQRFVLKFQGELVQVISDGVIDDAQVGADERGELEARVETIFRLRIVEFVG